MYDLRILLIWIILGFLLYLIAQKPDFAKNREVEFKDTEQTGKPCFPSFIPRKYGELVIIERLKETKFPPRIRVRNFTMDENTIGILPMDLITSHGVIPLKIDNERLILAMVNPFDFDAVDEIRTLTGKEIEAVEIRRKDFDKMVKCIADK